MKPKKAIESYENALLREPGMAKAWYNMGLIYIRAAAKTFIDMGSFVPDDNPIGQQGKILGQGLTKLLEGPAPKAKDEK
jgi:hypothetical protein